MKKYLSLILLCVMGFLIYVGGYVHAGSKFIPPHFHANFAVYIDGERIDFTDEKFSEDVAGCSITGKQNPEDRVHLHERNQDTIHVHADGVSWGHFFTNNDIVFSESFINIGGDFESQSGFYPTSENTGNLTFLLNGKEVKNPFNKLIGSKDRLLVSYSSSEQADALSLFETVSSNAGEYNEKYDPGSCGGTNDNGVLVILTEFVHGLTNMEH